MKMIRNCDLYKTLTIEQVQNVLELVFPNDSMGRGYKNPAGFGGHYPDDEGTVYVEEVMNWMVQEADRGN